jgi:hypothetical protein
MPKTISEDLKTQIASRISQITGASVPHKRDPLEMMVKEDDRLVRLTQGKFGIIVVLESIGEEQEAEIHEATNVNEAIRFLFPWWRSRHSKRLRF